LAAFLAGAVFTLACIILLLPWLRTIPRLGSLPALPWQAGIGAVLTMVAVVSLYAWLQHAAPAVEPRAAAATDVSGKTAVATDSAVDSWPEIANALGRGGTAMSTTTPAAPSAGGPMTGAIASLQARLAKGGGSADDWELLAKSYEFLGRPDEAGKARAHQLPPLPAADAGSASAAAPRTNRSGPGTAVAGEVSLAPTLKAQAPAGVTLFIVAKSVDSPGPPVAVLRTTVGRWPIKFELNDSEAMLPGRNLSSAGRVTLEARISQSGQPLPAAGDLQGATGVIDPAERRPQEILIDKVIK
jgi:uncharacterized membrane protein